MGRAARVLTVRGCGTAGSWGGGGEVGAWAAPARPAGHRCASAGQGVAWAAGAAGAVRRGPEGAVSPVHPPLARAPGQ